MSDQLSPHHPIAEPPPDTYPFPKHGWVCFHCGEEFSVARQKCHEFALRAAREHFGSSVDDEPLCQLANHPQAELAKLVREAGVAVRKAFDDRDTAEDEAVAAHGELSQIAHRFKGAKTVYDAWCMFESMEGRALAAEAIIAKLETWAPKLVAQAREEVCKPTQQQEKVSAT